jgi:glycosyltransferase domain-containing protein
MSVSTEMINWFELKLSGVGASKKCNDMIQLKNLTVIIPTYERQSYLLRQVLYWSDSPVTLIIVDGSKSPLMELQNLKMPGDMNFKYVHCQENFSNRLSLAGNMIKTPYAVMLGDDEFHLKGGLISAIDTLANNASLSGCIGQSLEFSLIESALKIGPGYSHNYYEVVEDKVSDRLNKAMVNYNTATCYAVMTKSAWTFSWGDIKAFSSPYAEELQQAMSTYIHGKFTSIQSVYWMRSFDEPLINILGEYDRTLSFNIWWKSQSYTHEKDEFVDRLAHKLFSEGGAESLDHAREILQTALKIYITDMDRPDSKNFLRSLLRKITVWIRGNSNFKFIEIINIWLSRFLFNALRRRELNDFISITELELSDKKRAFDKTKILITELKEIEQLVIEHRRYHR